MSSALVVIEPPTHWRYTRFDRLVRLSKESGRPDLEPLSVFLDEGVVPRASRDDNYNVLGADLAKYLFVRPGDIVFNKLRTWQGGIGVSRHTWIVSPAYYVCRPDLSQVEPRYLHYLLRSSPYLAELTRISKWMPPAQFDILWEDLRLLPILTAPLEEQRVIADFLDRETARIASLIDGRVSLHGLLWSRWESEVYRAVTKGVSSTSAMRSIGPEWIGEIPAHWTTPPVYANFDVQLGKMLNPERAAGPSPAPYLRNVNVQWDRIDLDDLATMSFEEADRLRYVLQPGDLLVCEGGEVGRAAIWRGELEECFYQKAVHRVRPRGDANARFLMYCLWAAASMNVFKVEGNQATIVHLTAEKLREHRFPMPPRQEQDAIVAYLDNKLELVRALAMRIGRHVEMLRERRQALITAVATGLHAVLRGAA